MALTITITEIGDCTSKLVDKSLSIRTSAAAAQGQADFTLYDMTELPVVGYGVTITDSTGTLFSGTIYAIAVDEAARGAQTWTAVTARDSASAATTANGPMSFTSYLYEPDDNYVTMMSDALTPYAWWRLGEPSGTTATDEMGTRNGTYTGSPTLNVTGAMATSADTAMTLNGSSQYVACGNALLAGGYGFAIAAWIKTSSALAQDIYTEHISGVADSAGPYFRFLIDSDSRIHLVYRDYAGTANHVMPTSGDWHDGAWHHFAMVKDGTSVVLYVDGVSVKSDTLTATNNFTGSLVATIGRSAGSTPTYFTGSIDEVMIWQDIRTAEDIRRIYHARNQADYVDFRYMQTSPDGSAQVTTAYLSTYTAGLAVGQRLAVSSPTLTLGFGRLIEFTVGELQITHKSTTPLYRASLAIGGQPIHLRDAFP
jgi:hypothetical protein